MVSCIIPENDWFTRCWTCAGRHWTLLFRSFISRWICTFPPLIHFPLVIFSWSSSFTSQDALDQNNWDSRTVFNERPSTSRGFHKRRERQGGFQTILYSLARSLIPSRKANSFPARSNNSLHNRLWTFLSLPCVSPILLCNSSNVLLLLV